MSDSSMTHELLPPAPLPAARGSAFRCIVADPPWNVKAGRDLGGYVVENGKQVWDDTHQSARDLEYPAMTVEEICALPVS